MHILVSPILLHSPPSIPIDACRSQTTTARPRTNPPPTCTPSYPHYKPTATPSASSYPTPSAPGSAKPTWSGNPYVPFPLPYASRSQPQIKPTYFRPAPLQTTPEGRLTNHGTTDTEPLPASSHDEEWLLIDSTPASCVQIGLYHYFSARGPIDLVISGPNYGRNTTAVFSLSSGTIGGAMEAAVCGVKSIALSYAFFDRNHDAAIIAGASELSARLIQHLYDGWGEGVQLYSVNVPLVESVGEKRILWTDVLQNKWSSGSCFQVVDVPDDEPSDAAADEAQIRRQEVSGKTGKEDEGEGQKHMRYTHKEFKWAPLFKDVYESVAQSEPGNDGWAVAQGYTSVTPLRANFMHVGGFEGEIKLGGEKNGSS
jgi:tubulin--tyrosine ligase